MAKQNSWSRDLIGRQTGVEIHMPADTKVVTPDIRTEEHVINGECSGYYDFQIDEYIITHCSPDLVIQKTYVNGVLVKENNFWRKSSFGFIHSP